MPTEKSQQIVNAFSKYVKTQDISLIEEHKLEEKDSRIVEGKRMSITEGDIQKYTPKQILGILSKFSIGAWIWVFGILGMIYSIGYSIGFNSGKIEVNSNNAISLHGLTVEQLIVLREIWTYQKTNKLNKVIISKGGFVFDEDKEEKTKINLAEKALGGDRGNPPQFEKLIVSMPAQFLKQIPETRSGSPYVVHVPEEAGRILDKNSTRKELGRQ